MAHIQYRKENRLLALTAVAIFQQLGHTKSDERFKVQGNSQ